jgi:hypothetical protein
MKAIHFINKRVPESNVHYVGLKRVSAPHLNNIIHYTSEAWNLSTEHVEQLEGGAIYLHEAQAQPAFFGGRITKIEPVEPSDADEGSTRYCITFKPEVSAKGASWPRAYRGANRWTTYPIAIESAQAA